ncbi:MAG TPA: hypothetical protein VLA05_05200 [Coriobacteriia bacterium]|nr:hypothetical protein [Coriobacteriia bacterium]
MPDELPKAQVVRFIVLATAVSLAVGVSLLTISWKTSSPFVLGLTVILVAGVPAWSMVIAAVGASAQRKAVYLLGMLVFLLTFHLVTYWTGVQQLATGSSEIAGIGNSAPVLAYRVILVSSPFVALILFAGKSTSIFWTKGDAGRKRKGSAL